MSEKTRLDIALVERGLADTRTRAQASIMSGIVFVNGQRCDKAGIRLRVPRPGLCTDNGAMVAALGAELVASGVEDSRLDIPADSSLPVTTVRV